MNSWHIRVFCISLSGNHIFITDEIITILVVKFSFPNRFLPNSHRISIGTPSVVINAILLPGVSLCEAVLEHLWASSSLSYDSWILASKIKSHPTQLRHCRRRITDWFTHTGTHLQRSFLLGLSDHKKRIRQRRLAVCVKVAPRYWVINKCR